MQDIRKSLLGSDLTPVGLMRVKRGKKQSNVDEIKVKMSAACEQSKENSGKEDIITQVCCNMSDRLARQRNMVIFNLPESSSILREETVKN